MAPVYVRPAALRRNRLMAIDEVDPHWQINVNRQLADFSKQLNAFQETISKRFDVFSVEISALRRQDDLGTAERQNIDFRLKLLEEGVKQRAQAPIQEALVNQEVLALRKELKRIRKQPKDAAQQVYQQKILSANQQIALTGAVALIVTVVVTLLSHISFH